MCEVYVDGMGTEKQAASARVYGGDSNKDDGGLSQTAVPRRLYDMAGGRHKKVGAQ